MKKLRYSKVKIRFIKVISFVIVVAIGVYIILFNLEKNITFFYPPSKLHEIKDISKLVRIGGIIKEGSYRRIQDNSAKFIITDYIVDIEVSYVGILPALFKEKQGIVARGKMQSNNLFIASELLTKHDEYYRPPDVAKD